MADGLWAAIDNRPRASERVLRNKKNTRDAVSLGGGSCLSNASSTLSASQCAVQEEPSNGVERSEDHVFQRFFSPAHYDEVGGQSI